MPKAERGSVKDIANRMKAKGLQKLKFYCQMCQKQCRDANGFKCHIQSESHLRQMKIFGDNASGYLKQYSDEFEKAFLTNLKMRHGTKKVNANNVYQEVIADKQHIHMNATHWTTLTDFVQYLGKSKKCIVEENHSDGNGGWMISFIERDAGILARQEAQQRKEAADRRAEEAFLERMKTQRIEAAKALEKVTGGASFEATSILDKEGVNPIKIGIASTAKAKKTLPTTFEKKSAFGGDDDDDDDENDALDAKAKDTQSNVERMMNETKNRAGAASDDLPPTRKRKHSDKPSRYEDQQPKSSKSKAGKHRANDRETKGWLHRDILVRVISKKLEGGKYFRKKAVVDRVFDGGFVAEVEILDEEDGTGGDVLRLDQSDLETVVPKRASRDKTSKVRILRGKYRGESATVEYLDKTRYQADLVLRKSKDDNGLLRDVAFEDFSKVA